MLEDEIQATEKKSETQPKRRRPKKVVIPRRAPSIVVPEKVPIFITPDKTTCDECICFPKEDAYIKNKKLNPCQVSPLTLYELASKVVDGLKYPVAFDWSTNDVVKWLEDDVGLPQYKDCILTNNINGRRLIMFEDPSKLADLNIKDFEHIKRITSKIRELFSIEFIRFVRSISLPPRKPLTHCTWFKSRTGPSWGVRENWSRCDILRWMNIIMTQPRKMDHWDLVWYQKPEFPKIKFARIEKRPIYGKVHIPHYKPQPDDKCREYLVPRKFRIQDNISESKQYIWMEHIPPPKKEKEGELKKMAAIQKESRVMPKKINLAGLSGKEFILAKRKIARQKFLP